MSEHRSRSGPWTLLIHDPGSIDRDPKWLLAVIAGPEDVRPAAGEEVDDLAAAWLRARNGGGPHRLIPVPGASVWRVEADA
jgi:hypothetical protein